VGPDGVGARGVPQAPRSIAVARVLAFVPDLLFGSSVVAALQAAGHEVELVSDLPGAEPAKVDVVVVDLTVDPEARIAAVQHTVPGDAATLAFYSHVEQHVRELAEQAGFDLVVPRSRMAREGAQLVERLSG
jgi:nucleoside-diphosphate-sugar epimerase